MHEALERGSHAALTPLLATSLATQALLPATTAYWLDEPSDVSCKETTRQHAVDDARLSCNSLRQLVLMTYGQVSAGCPSVP
jgi:hypothetical protein